MYRLGKDAVSAPNTTSTPALAAKTLSTTSEPAET